MNWLKNLFKKEEREPIEEVPCETMVSEPKPEPIKKTRKQKLALQDKEGNDYICPLCNNEDNETGEYNPIIESNKRTFKGSKWHKKCLRAFKKKARSGNLG